MNLTLNGRPLYFHKHSYLLFCFLFLCQQTFPDYSWIQSDMFWTSENWLYRRDLSGRKFSDRLTMSALRSGRHQHGKLLQREVGEGPDGTGHPSDWQRRGLIETHNQRKCIALWRAFWRATLVLHLSQTEQDTKYQASLKSQPVSMRWIQHINVSFNHHLEQCTKKN